MRTWYDNDKDDGVKKSYYFTPGYINDTVYISVENYPYQVVPNTCLNNTFAAIVKLEVRHNNKYYSIMWYDAYPYWISVPASS